MFIKEKGTQLRLALYAFSLENALMNKMCVAYLSFVYFQASLYCFLTHVPFTLPGSIEHRAQVILYTLLMSDRYSQAVDAGLLFYMKSAHMLSVPGFLHEKRALIMKRNEVARYLTLNRAGATGTMPGWYSVTYVMDLHDVPLFRCFHSKKN